MTTSFLSSSCRWLALVSLPLALCGCPDPEGEYELFDERFIDIYGVITAGSCAELADCEDPQFPEVGEIDGPYLFTFSATFDPTLPVLFHADLSTQAGAEGLELLISMQVLNAYDRSTRIGETFNLGPYPVNPDDHCYHGDLGTIELPGESNPFSEKPLIAHGILDGKLCRQTDFLCGALGGQVISPIDLPLTGSTYTFDRFDGSTYTNPPLINCEREQAREAPTP